MKLREVATPVALIVLATGTAAYAYFVDRAGVSDADRAARRRDVFPSFRVEDVTRVELTGPAGPLVLERRGDAGAGSASWAIEAPRPGPADPGAVDALLRELEVATRVRDLEDGAPTGLSAPRIRGAVTLGAQVYRLALGAEAPRPAGAAYMRVDGEGTFVVGRTLATQLLRGYDAYRPRALAPYGESDLARVEVSGPRGEGFTLDRHGSSFRLESDGVRAGRAAVDHLFAALSDAQAETFVDDALADRQLAAGATSLVLVPRDPDRPRATIRVGGDCPQQPGDVVAARTAPTLLSACVSRAIAEAIGLRRAALVDASPFYAHGDEIEDLRLEDLVSALRVDLARRGDGWHERAPEERDLGSEQSDSANLLAAALAGARASEVLGAASAAAERPFVARSRATIVRTGGSSTEIVELAAPAADGATWARRRDDGALLRLPPDVARRLQPHPAALRARILWTAPIDPADLVAIDSTCGRTAERVERQPGGWTLIAPAGFAADPLAASDLAAALAHARAEEFVAEADDGTFGLTGPDSCKVSLVARVSAEGGTRPMALAFGDECAGGFYAKTSDDPAVFVAPASLRALASRPVLERRRFEVDPQAVTGLVLVLDGARRRVDLAAEAGAHARAAAAVLAVRAALHTGAAEPGEGFDHPTLELEITSRPAGGSPAATHLIFGARTALDDVNGYFARASGLDATFFAPGAGIDALLAEARGDPGLAAADAGAR